jgi:hypothetical protein
MSIVELLDYKIVLVCIYRSPDGELHLFLKIWNSTSKSAKKRSNFMWGLEHKFYGRQDKTIRIKILAAVV